MYLSNSFAKPLDSTPEIQQQSHLESYYPFLYSDLNSESSLFERAAPRLGRAAPRLGRAAPRLGRAAPRLGRRFNHAGRYYDNEVDGAGDYLVDTVEQWGHEKRALPRLGRSTFYFDDEEHHSNTQ
ncbi:unnamed protein product [Didymodactylos carnosus]|uniref:Uncharacterized protein n=1 Tax=Didymodactylos carnosus TaxID=1234261 RepID=A0A8S2EG01_9BILA|nr:unnamed protein product [Didymodactylos carnosus]CAF4022974.1 unnamed protein product [Didymodactylos carnosus]